MSKLRLTALTPDDIGRWVEYRDFNRVERGRIKSFNAQTVWVVFKCGGNWPLFYNYTGNACEYDDLRFIEAPSEGTTNA